MHTHRPGRLFGWISAVLVGLVLTTAALGLADSVPAEAVDAARRAVAEAREAEAGLLAPQQMEAAEVEWNAVLDAVRAHGESVLTTRWIDSVRVRSVRTERLAAQAALAAEGERLRLLRRLTSGRQDASQVLERARTAVRYYPIGRVSADSVSRAASSLAQLDGAASRGNLLGALAHLVMLERTVSTLESDLNALEDSILAEGIEWSARLDRLRRSGRYPIVAVDKAARRLVLHSSPTKQDTFVVDLGPEWLGDKVQEGDKRTPEGEYRVTKRLGHGQTRYHRALLLNYPSASDRSRFAKARNAGVLASGARIGGLIEIHGGGGRDGDWTDGCVALVDREMERLFQAVPEGATVLIAPSLYDGN